MKRTRAKSGHHSGEDSYTGLPYTQDPPEGSWDIGPKERLFPDLPPKITNVYYKLYYIEETCHNFHFDIWDYQTTLRWKVVHGPFHSYDTAKKNIHKLAGFRFLDGYRKCAKQSGYLELYHKEGTYDKCGPHVEISYDIKERRLSEGKFSELRNKMCSKPDSFRKKMGPALSRVLKLKETSHNFLPVIIETQSGYLTNDSLSFRFYGGIPFYEHGELTIRNSHLKRAGGYIPEKVNEKNVVCRIKADFVSEILKRHEVRSMEIG